MTEPDAPTALSLQAGALSAELIGGDLLSVSSMRLAGTELLVAPETLVPGYRVHGRRAGITLLHPWANRLGSETYRFDGHDAELAPDATALTRDANGLAIHGLSAPVPWRLEPTGPDAATASLAWTGEPAFPFPHQITVTVTLAADDDTSGRLEVATEIAASTPTAVPVAVGWHPYFRIDRTSGAAIDLPALSWLSADAHGLPTGEREDRPAQRIVVTDQGLDDGLAGLEAGSELALSSPTHTIAVRWGEGYPDGQVFAPPDAPVVSLEPMAAPTNALARGGPLAVARSGQPWRGTFAVLLTAR